MLQMIFSRRTPLAIALAALVAGAVGLVAAGSSSAARHSPAVLKFVSVEVGPGGGADVPPAGDSVGDIDTFKSVVSDPRTGKRVGLTESSCAIFDTAKPGGYGPPVRDATYHCSMITYLRRGLITAFGSVAFDHDGRISVRPFVITGGTGRYAGAGGWVESVEQDEGKSLAIVHLVR